MEHDPRLVNAPNSIYHGCNISRMSSEMTMTIGMERMRDFLEFLFDHSEHCDHISQSEAWKEFEEFESKIEGEWITKKHRYDR